MRGEGVMHLYFLQPGGSDRGSNYFASIGLAEISETY